MAGLVDQLQLAKDATSRGNWGGEEDGPGNRAEESRNQGESKKNILRKARPPLPYGIFCFCARRDEGLLFDADSECSGSESWSMRTRSWRLP